MELREFVKRTLTDILNGVGDAQKMLDEGEPQDGRVNPPIDGWLNPDPVKVSFDVAVTASEGDSVRAGIMVWSGLFGGNVQGQKATNTSDVSRVQFSVPVQLPVHLVPKPKS